jgi:hypothetical protein
MTTGQKVTNFVKQVMAQLKGDENQVVATKNARKGDSAVQSQISALRSKLVDDESNVEDKTEALYKAKYPTALITNNNSYVTNIVYAQENLDAAKKQMDETKASIEFFTGLQEELNAEAEA